MKLLEYQAKEQFAAAGIPVKAGRVARSADEGVAAAEALGPIAVKAQVPIGGRGKAGGIKLARGPEEARAPADASPGMGTRGYTGHQGSCGPAAHLESGV